MLSAAFIWWQEQDYNGNNGRAHFSDDLKKICLALDALRVAFRTEQGSSAEWSRL